MADRDVLLAKTASIQQCLRRIESVRGRPDMPALDREDILVLNLQRAVQCALDMAEHVVAADRLGLADTEQRAFDLLAANGRIPPELAGRLRRLAGFRNIVVHEYAVLDPAIDESITRDRRGDLTALASALLDAA
jgi:uncharacterized protein YutE (UPF0331/DUF86 family)